MKKGFTLIELLIVIIIVGILGTIGFTQYTDVVERSRGAEARAVLGQLRSLCAAISMGPGVSSCSNPSLGIGTANDLVPIVCRASHFFNYTALVGTGSNVTFTAYRCVSGTGRTPGHGAAPAHTITLTTDYTLGTDTYTSAEGY
jgi:prepilin-type N-terminal cleavage/methylation domain-containing protein